MSSTAIPCTHCGLDLRQHIAYQDVQEDSADLDRACFDATDGYWEGFYCPPSQNGRYEETQ